jgi:hypothetical protein
MKGGGFKGLGFAWLSLVMMSVALAGSSNSGVLEGRIQILVKAGTNLAGVDDTSATKEKIPYVDSPLAVLSKNGKSEVAQVTPDSEGRFHLNLPAGDYVLDVKQRGRLRVTERPFTIISGQTVRVDLTVESAVEPM